MEKAYEVVQDTAGNVVSGASVSVYNADTGALATIYEDNETTVKSQPFQTTSKGELWFKAANGNYRIDVTSGSTVSIYRTLFDPNDAVIRGALVYNSTNFSLPTTTLTALPFDSESYDTDNIHDPVTNNTRLTVPTGATKVRLKAYANFPSTSATTRTMNITKNGSGIYVGSTKARDDSGNLADLVIASPVLTVVAGDYFEVKLYQSTGGAISITGGTSGYWFAMEIIN